MSQIDITQSDQTRSGVPQSDFESRMRYGLSEVLNERPELRDALPLASMMDDAVRWCA
jgi:hypothetical protein